MVQEGMKSVSLVTILILSALGASHCQVNSSGEIKALLDFKAANAGSSTHVRGWVAGRNNCKPSPWRGVTCWSTGLVRWLRLPNANLSGKISNALGGLRVLTRLDLRGNQMGGQIPAGLRTLVRLKRLLLSSNKFQGIVPKFIGNMTILEELALAHNNLGGNIPDDFFDKFTRLWMVDMSDNLFTGPIPANLTNLVSLKTVFLGGNNFSGPVPASLGSSISLQTVDLSGNALTGILPLNWTLSNLTSLNLSNNQLTGQVPSALLDLPSLVNLSLAGNNFTGVVPATATCRFGRLSFAGNPNLFVEPCSIQIVITLPSPSSAPEEFAPLPKSSGDQNPEPSPLHPILKDTDSSPKSRLLLIVLLVVGNIGMILLGAGLASLIYVRCKKSGPNDPQKNGREVAKNTYSMSRSIRTSSARTSDCRASIFSESANSDYEKSTVFQSGVFRNDQPDIHILQLDYPTNRSM